MKPIEYSPRTPIDIFPCPAVVMQICNRQKFRNNIRLKKFARLRGMKYKVGDHNSWHWTVQSQATSHSSKCFLAVCVKISTWRSVFWCKSSWRPRCTEHSRKDWWWSWYSRDSRRCSTSSPGSCRSGPGPGWPSWRPARCTGSRSGWRPAGWRTESWPPSSPAASPAWPSSVCSCEGGSWQALWSSRGWRSSHTWKRSMYQSKEIHLIFSLIIVIILNINQYHNINWIVFHLDVALPVLNWLILREVTEN